jgi:hypothetical protein
LSEENNDNLLTIERGRPAGQNPSALSAGNAGGNTEAANAGDTSSPPGYKLDWVDQNVKLAKGRFVHRLRRPTAEEILARDKDIETETQIGKDGGFSLPDPTAAEDIDAKYHDIISLEVSGYPEGAQIPTRHKAAAFNAIYRREFELEDAADIFAEEITIVEEIGVGDEPDFTVKHTLKQLSESELKKFRQRSQGGEMKQGKRGKMIFRPYSNLRLAIQIYDASLVSISGAHVSGKTFSAETRPEFLAAVDPLIKRSVVSTLVGEVSSGLLD